MIHALVDLFNILLRAGQHDVFKQEMECVVIGFHCKPFPMQRWVVHQSKLQYLWRYAPCDVEIVGTAPQWVALATNSPLPTGGCQLKGETAYLKGLQLALERQKNLYIDSLTHQVPLPVRSAAFHLRQILRSLLPAAPWLQRQEFDEGQYLLRACFERLNRIERAQAAAQQRDAQC